MAYELVGQQPRRGMRGVGSASMTAAALSAYGLAGAAGTLRGTTLGKRNSLGLGDWGDDAWTWATSGGDSGGDSGGGGDVDLSTGGGVPAPAPPQTPGAMPKNGVCPASWRDDPLNPTQFCILNPKTDVTCPKGQLYDVFYEKCVTPAAGVDMGTGQPIDWSGVNCPVGYSAQNGKCVLDGSAHVKTGGGTTPVKVVTVTPKGPVAPIEQPWYAGLAGNPLVWAAALVVVGGLGYYYYGDEDGASADLLSQANERAKEQAMTYELTGQGQRGMRGVGSSSMTAAALSAYELAGAAGNLKGTTLGRRSSLGLRGIADDFSIPLPEWAGGSGDGGDSGDAPAYTSPGVECTADQKLDENGNCVPRAFSSRECTATEMLGPNGECVPRKAAASSGGGGSIFSKKPVDPKAPVVEAPWYDGLMSNPLTWAALAAVVGGIGLYYWGDDAGAVLSLGPWHSARRLAGWGPWPSRRPLAASRQGGAIERCGATMPETPMTSTNGCAPQPSDEDGEPLASPRQDRPFSGAEVVANALLRLEARQEEQTKQLILSRRALETIAGETQAHSVIARSQGALIESVQGRLSGVEAVASRTHTDMQQLLSLPETVNELTTMMGQTLAEVSKLTSVNEVQDDRISKHDSITNEHGQALATIEPKVEVQAKALATIEPKVRAHDRVFKPTVMLRNLLLFSGGVAAYVAHVLANHFDSLSKIKAFFAH